MPDGRLALAPPHICVLKVPGLPLFVVLHTRVIVALVQELEDAAKNLGLLVREIDATSGRLEELAAASSGEVWRVAEDFLVGGKEAGLVADTEGDDGADERLLRYRG